MYTPFYKMNQKHTKRYGKIHWAGIDVYFYEGEKNRIFFPL